MGLLREVARNWRDEALVLTYGLSKNVKGLMKVAQSEDHVAALNAVWALSALRDPSAIPVLRDVMRTHPDDQVRENAAAALGDLGDRDSVDELIHRARQGSTGAALALDKVGEDELVHPLFCELLRTGRTGSKVRDKRLQDVVVARLASLEDLDALSLAVVEHPDSRVRMEVAKILGDLCDRRALPYLERAALDDEDDLVQTYASRARRQILDGER